MTSSRRGSLAFVQPHSAILSPPPTELPRNDQDQTRAPQVDASNPPLRYAPLRTASQRNATQRNGDGTARLRPFHMRPVELPGDGDGVRWVLGAEMTHT